MLIGNFGRPVRCNVQGALYRPFRGFGTGRLDRHDITKELREITKISVEVKYFIDWSIDRD